MKTLLICIGVLLTSLTFQSCTNNIGQNYDYTWKVKVTYTNGDIDTVTCGQQSFKGNEVSIWLKTTAGGVLSDGGTSPCLTISCGVYSQPVVCGVRKYDILSLVKTPIDTVTNIKIHS